MAETHQQIKDRLFKTASALWGHKGLQAEGAFDPLVGLLFGACATELEKISHDIEESRGRALERLVQLLYPEVLSNAIPGHGVAFAYPSEKSLALPPETPFYYSRKQAGPSDGGAPVWKNIYFSPSAAINVQQSAILYMATTRRVWAMQEGLHKETVLTGSDDGPWHAGQNSVWLAVEKPANLPAAGALFYFDMRNSAGKAVFYDSLPFATWHTGEAAVNHVPGYSWQASVQGKPGPEEIVTGKTSVMNRVLRHVNGFYQRCFICVEHLNKAPLSDDLPEQLLDIYGSGALPALKKSKLAWIRIDFPENIQIPALAENLFISLNCFPVVNRNLVVMPHKLMNYVNIIPLASDAFFLDLAELTDAEGNALNEMHQEDRENLASLHYGGVERFSEKNAISAVEGLIQQLRDESSAFSSLGNDFLSHELKALQQSLNKLEQHTADRQMLKGDTPYLVLPGRDKTGASNVYVKYWITNGADANHIKAGTALSLYKGADLQGQSIRLLTTVTGGRDSLAHRDKVLAYKTALLNKEKLVTAEDIAAFCRLRLSRKDAVVEVKKAYRVQEGLHEGFVKIIDISIYINSRDTETMRQAGTLELWQQDLEQAIQAHSSFFMPLRVTIKAAGNKMNNRG